MEVGDINGRGLPIYIDGMLFTTSGPRRTVVGMDPATGKTIWSFQEPLTPRHEYSMRSNHGKGVAYTKINGRGAVLVTTPGFFLHALDVKTGQPIEGWGGSVPVTGFPKSGSIDMLKDLIADWEPWIGLEADLRRRRRACRSRSATSPPPRRRSSSTTCSIIGNSAEQGYNQTRIENVPGDILAYDVKSGKFMWKFHVIPRPGEFGHETWENDAWKWTGDISSWAPMSADPARGLVYIPTNGATMDYFGGFRPGDNLFSTSFIALDVKTGKRVWHQQLVKHDIWNYDVPNAPVLLDVNVNGQRVPGVFAVTKQSWVYSYNRQTGAADLADSRIGPRRSRRCRREAADDAAIRHQTRAVRSAGAHRGRTLIDFTPGDQEAGAGARAGARPARPALRAAAPSRQREGKGHVNICPGGGGGANITGPPAADPTSGVIFITSTSGCSPTLLAPAIERDNDKMTGKTVAQWAHGARQQPAGAEARSERPAGGHPGSLQGPARPHHAIDLNTGEHLWMIPHGDMDTKAAGGVPQQPAAEGHERRHELGPARSRGDGRHLDAAAGDGTDRGQPAAAVRDRQEDRQARRRGGTPRLGEYGLMTYLHQGKQYIVVPMNGGYAAYALP